jgi:SNF2 family DNA or RNA helicase
VLEAAGRKELEAALQHADVLVVNYAQLRFGVEALALREWLAVILDEGQHIKNPDSQSAQAARRLGAEHRLVLTGTPVENRLLDLWSLMAFAMPGVLGSRDQFLRYYAQTDLWSRRRLGARLRPFLLRRTKEEVAPELPPKSEEVLLCPLEGPQHKLYQAELKHAQQSLLKVKTQKQLNRLRFNFLTSLLKLRQIACHAALVSERQREAHSAKLEALLERLEEVMETGSKALVFSQFVGMLKIIEAEVKQRGWSHYYLDGQSERRDEVVEAFQGHEGPAVFLASLRAGGFGLNLTAAQYVFLYDPWWNPAVECQAIDRTHRIGQTQHVFAYRLIAEGTVEEKVCALQERKGLIAKALFEDAKGGASLTLEDLRFLFELESGGKW